MEVFIKQAGKVVALDWGTVWTGVAISDISCTFARPLTAVSTPELHAFLKQLLTDESIDTIVMGHPITLKGTASEQTKLVENAYGELNNQFSSVAWALWDERFSSKQAASMGKRRTREQRLNEQARTAAIILDSYLLYKKTQQSNY
jgi:putative Holliday junction resolvase